jgi:hypothetical protein
MGGSTKILVDEYVDFGPLKKALKPQKKCASGAIGL